MAHTFTNLLTHVIFSTKDREPHIDDEMRPRLLAYMGGIVREIGGTAILVNGTSDHVHALLVLPPSLAIADALREVKANSSRWVHQVSSARAAFAWQAGYGAFSVSESNVEAVKGYIAKQEEHHRNVTFKDEFIAFLKRHHIAYDERYIWE